MSLMNCLKSKVLQWVKPLPFECRHIEYSTISCLDDEPKPPTRRLLDLSLAAIGEAREIDLAQVSAQMPRGPLYPDIWPGEHYKLLAGFLKTMRPRKVIEVGTFEGLSALTMLSQLPEDGELITVDIIPWNQFDTTLLKESDFKDGRFKQVIGDLSNKAFFEQFLPSLSQCDFLFVDAPKNIVFERTFIGFLESISLPKNCLVVFDDIRKWEMLQIWREIKRPKLDLTSFGHWSGTGVIDWNG